MVFASLNITLHTFNLQVYPVISDVLPYYFLWQFLHTIFWTSLWQNTSFTLTLFFLAILLLLNCIQFKSPLLLSELLGYQHYSAYIILVKELTLKFYILMIIIPNFFLVYNQNSFYNAETAMQLLFCYPTSVFWLYFFVIKGLAFYKYQSGKKDLVIFLVIGSCRKKIQAFFKYQWIVILFFVENPNINFFVLWHLCCSWMPYILKQSMPANPTQDHRPILRAWNFPTK